MPGYLPVHLYLRVLVLITRPFKKMNLGVLLRVSSPLSLSSSLSNFEVFGSVTIIIVIAIVVEVFFALSYRTIFGFDSQHYLVVTCIWVG